MFLYAIVHFSIVNQSSAFEKVLHAIHQSSDFTETKVHFSIANQSSAFEKVLHAIYQSSDFTKTNVHFTL